MMNNETMETTNITQNNEINADSLKEWFDNITDPKQQAIVTNIEIVKIENYIKGRNFAKQELVEELKTIEDKIKEEVRTEAAQGPERGGPLSSEAKILDEVKRRITVNEEYKKTEECIDAITKDMANNEINLSFYKRTFQILIAFANQWVK